MAEKKQITAEQAGTVNKTKAKRNIGNLLFYTSAFLVAFLLLVCMLGGIFYFIVKNNINGITERHRSVLKEIPIIKNAVSEDTGYDDEIEHLSNYELKQLYRELLKKHEELQASNEEARENIEKLREANKEYLNLVNEYKIKEDKLNEDREKLQEDMKKLQQAVAEGNKDVFMEFFERMDQQAAQEIYEKVLREREADAKKRELADIISGMEPESAAAIIVELGRGNMDTIISILTSMGKESVALILEQTEPALASEIILKLSDLYLREDNR